MKILHPFLFFSIKYAGGTSDLMFKIAKAQHKKGLKPIILSGNYMFDNELREKLPNVEFKILNIISKKNIHIIKWEMIYFAFNKRNSIFGLSEVTISKNNKIVSHIDYWDSYNNFYTQIPLFGLVFKFVLNLVRKRI